MAYITKRGSSYSVRYTYQDEHGKSCDKWESFPTKEEAVKRQKQIEHELATGNFLIPSTVTVAEFLMDWLLYNKPLEYVQLVLGGGIEHYLSLGCDHGRLEDQV